MTTGERIREIRRDQNISQTQLAQAAGLNQPQVSAIADGMQVDKSEVLRVWEEHKDD